MGAPIVLHNPCAYPVESRQGQPVTRRCYYALREVYTASGCEVNYVFVRDMRREEVDAERDAERVRFRALKKIKQRIMALEATHMLTLTYRENVTSIEQSKKDLVAFYRLVKKHVKGWKFVGVAEFQERGAVHWHLAVKGFQNVRLLRSFWLSVVGASGGNIDVKFFAGKSCGVIAGYISKYLGKGFELGEKPHYSHYYVTSRGLVVETRSFRLYGYSDAQLDRFITDLVADRGCKVRTRWRRDPWNEAGAVRSW